MVLWRAFRLLVTPATWFIPNDRDPTVLPEGYDRWSAGEKLAWLRQRARETNHRKGEGLVPPEIRLSAVHSLRRLDGNLDVVSDVRPAAMGPKALHPAGVTAAVRLEKLTVAEIDGLDWHPRPGERLAAIRNAQSGGQPIATGLLAGCEHALLRLSLAVPYRFRLLDPPFGYVCGAAIKCLVDGSASRNLVLLDSMEGQGDDGNFFRRPLSTILSIARRDETRALAALFTSIEHDAADVPATPLASVTGDGAPVQEPWVPSQLHIVGTPEARASHVPGHEDFRSDLLEGLRPGMWAFTVFAAHVPGSLGIPILKVVVADEPVASGFDDDDLLFQHNRKPAVPRVPLQQRASLLLLDIFTWLFTFAFAFNAVWTGGRGTHAHGVAGRGRIRIDDDPAYPEHPFFRPGATMPVVLRHANVVVEDDAKKGFRGLALRIQGADHEGPLDLLMNTGPRGVFWHAWNFRRGVLAAGTRLNLARWYVQNTTPPMYEHMQLAVRRAPERYTNLFYYARIAFEFFAFDRKPRLARFRCRPLEDREDDDGLAKPGTDDRRRAWSRARLPGQDRPTDYLRSNFTYDLQQGRERHYALEIQTRTQTPDDSNEVYSIKSDWPDAPWKRVGVITLDEALTPDETERLEFGLYNMPRSFGVPPATSILDYRSIGSMRLKVYPRLQAFRRWFGIRPRRTFGVPGPHRRRGALTLVFPIRSLEAQQQLDTLMSEVGRNLDAFPELPFETFDELHFARWAIVPAARPEAPGTLVYSANVDGNALTHLWRIARDAPLVRRLLAHCSEAPDDQASTHELYTWMRLRQRRAQLVHEGSPGRSVHQIRKEEELRFALAEFIEERDWAGHSPLEMVDALRAMVQARPDLPQGPPPARSWGEQLRFALEKIGFPLMWTLPIWLVFATLALVLPWTTALATSVGAALGVVLIGAVLVRYAEATDAVYTDDADAQAMAVSAEEDHQIQNQLSMVLSIKKTWFRTLLLKLTLHVGFFLTRHKWNRGVLAGIPTIHFARFIVDDEEGRLVFFSNYDGSWEKYLGDFLTVGALAVVPIWTHCEGCPRTRFLFWPTKGFGGLFRTYIRKFQVPTQIWYSGYRRLTVVDINANTQMREELWSIRDEASARRWLGRLAR